MDRVELLERKEKKGDILLKMVAISGEMPANLPEKIVGSKSYTASLITALKKKGYLLLRYRDGVRGYVLGKKGKNIFWSIIIRIWKVILQEQAKRIM